MPKRLGAQNVFFHAMQVYYDLHSYTPPQNLVVTIGSYDGLHAGHRQIIRRTTELAQKHSAKSALITFEPHPRIALKKDASSLRLLTSLPEKIAILADLGLDILIVQNFDEAFYSQTAEDYIANFLVKTVGAKHLVIGYDHRFGLHGQGNTPMLLRHSTELGYAVHEIPAHLINENAVSSTKIRNYLLNAQVPQANLLLGYAYQLRGKVVKGDQIGRTLGYPTANVQLADAYKLCPANGIYAVNVLVNHQKFGGMLYIGSRPSLLHAKPEPRIEVFIFDFQQDIYDQTISTELLHFLRPDQKFEGLEALKNQLKADEVAARAVLGA